MTKPRLRIFQRDEELLARSTMRFNPIENVPNFRPWVDSVLRGTNAGFNAVRSEGFYTWKMIGFVGKTAIIVCSHHWSQP